MSAPDLAALSAALEQVLGERPRALTPIPGAANSRVLRAELAEGPLLVKVYFRHPADPRDRLAAETGMLRHLTRHGVDCVPAVRASSAAHGLAVLELVEGTRLSAASIGASEVAALARLLGEHWRVRTAAGADELPLASEATFCLGDLFALLEQRRAGLLADLEAQPDEPAAAGVRRLLTGPLAKRLAREQARFDAARLAAELPPSARTLSPSDHGFHNALRRPDGALVFIDFEYGGWDDPAKMLADALLHPAVPLPAALRASFLDDVLARLGDAGELRRRLSDVYPLYALKWVLIMLNWFRPVVRERRRHAGADRTGAEQLALAERAFAAIPPLGVELSEVLGG